MAQAPPGDLAEVQAHLADFAEVPLRRLPLYRHLTARVAEDPDVARLLLLARPPVRWATLLLAAIHDRLLLARQQAGDDAAAAAVEPLCAWYPSTSGHPRPVGPGPDDPWPEFRRLALEDPVVAEHMATRGTQTNEVGRSATTVVALGLIQGDVESPLGLIEVGASAGLNLRVDSYSYRYVPDGSDPAATAELRLEPRHSMSGGRPTLGTRWRDGAVPPVPTEMPVIGHRIGLDLQPVDVGDDAAARWLIACQWPEQADRLARCREAVADARADPPPLRAGDLVASTAELVRNVPAECHPVVLSTWCLAYLDEPGQRAFMAELDRVATERDLSLVFQEQPVAVPGLDPPPRPDGGSAVEPTALCRLDWRGGRRTSSTRLADQHPHGTWSRWFT